MLVEMAIADAYSIAWEFCDNPAPNDLSGYYQHPKYTDMVPGCYTDDTQRSLANAEMVLRSAEFMREFGTTHPHPYNPLGYIALYQATFAADPRPGYSRRFEAFLKENLETDFVDMALKITRKSTNGAVMGAAVLGYLPTVEQVMLAAAAQALSTHSYATIPYAQIVALAAHYMINDLGDMNDLLPFLYNRMEASGSAIRDWFSTLWQKPEKVTMGASSAVHLMLYALPKYDSLSDLIRLAVDTGGDTDSAAAIMVAVASESRHYTNDIPDVLIKGLENGPYGIEHLRTMDARLKAMRG